MGRNTSDILAGRSMAVLALVTAAALLLPIVAAPFPPLHDYPFHLARADALAALAGQVGHPTPYRLGSFLLPNVGMDVLSLALTAVLPPAVAGRVFLGLVLLIQLGGVAALYRAVHGSWSPWPLLAGFVLYNWIFLYGFLSYLLGLGVMLWAAAAWIGMAGAGWPARLGVALAFSIALLFCHLVAFGLFGVLVGGLALHEAWTRRADRADALRHLLLPALPLLITLLVFFVLSPTAGEVRQPIAYHAWSGWKPLLARRVLLGSNPMLDLATLGPVALLVGGLALSRRVTLAPALRLPLAALVLTFVAMPFALFGSLFADARLPIAIVLVAIAATGLRNVSPRATLLGAGAIALLLTVRGVVIAQSWQQESRLIERHLAAFATLPPGSTLWAATAAPYPGLAYTSDAELDLWHPPLKHVASLAALDSDVFVPSSFADPFKQPIAVPPELAAAKRLQDDNPFKTPTAEALAEVVTRIRAVPLPGPSFLLLSYPAHLRGPIPPGLIEIERDPLFVLLRVEQ